MEECVARVMRDGKVTIPMQLRDRMCVAEGDYVRFVLVEVLKRGSDGNWVKRRVE
jgi:bifunctional DNA-binding transcriptional regulator/antitoxin component of YhaV-PrlF toxin-antitoxin module